MSSHYNSSMSFAAASMPPPQYYSPCFKSHLRACLGLPLSLHICVFQYTTFKLYYNRFPIVCPIQRQRFQKDPLPAVNIRCLHKQHQVSEIEVLQSCTAAKDYQPLSSSYPLCCMPLVIISVYSLVPVLLLLGLRTEVFALGTIP